MLQGAISNLSDLITQSVMSMSANLPQIQWFYCVLHAHAVLSC
jgi:hypothetical protein